MEALTEKTEVLAADADVVGFYNAKLAGRNGLHEAATAAAAAAAFRVGRSIRTHTSTRAFSLRDSNSSRRGAGIQQTTDVHLRRSHQICGCLMTIPDL